MSRIETIGNATIRFGDCRESMRAMIAAGEKVQMCVTSPPYFGLRSYMPDAVKLRDNIDPEEIASVLKELEQIGVKPCRNVNREYLQEI
jgi:DNA modification methylase